MASEYFNKLFISFHDKHPIIIIKEVEAKVLRALLDYIYIGETELQQDDLKKLISAAEYFKIKGLADDSSEKDDDIQPIEKPTSEQSDSFSKRAFESSLEMKSEVEEELKHKRNEIDMPVEKDSHNETLDSQVLEYIKYFLISCPVTFISISMFSV